MGDKNSENIKAFEIFSPPPLEEGDLNMPSLKLQRIIERQELLKEHFSNKDSFTRYVNSHPLSSLIKRRITEEVALHRSELVSAAYELKTSGSKKSFAKERNTAEIERLPDEKQIIAEIEKLPVEEQYRILAITNYAEPSHVFSEICDRPTLCELKHIKDTSDDRYNGQINDEDASVFDHFQKQWYMLTKEKLKGPPFPSVTRLTHLIAPVPYSSCWSEDLYSREARSMGHTPALDDNNKVVEDSKTDGTENGSSSAKESGTEKEEDSTNKSRRASHDNQGSANRSLITDSTSTEAENTEDPSEGEGASSVIDSNAPQVGCDVGEIYRLAGGSIPQQPSNAEDRVAFPGTPRWGEDIFYDYAVMVPVSDCEINEQNDSPEARSIEAAQLSAHFALGILDFLKDNNLAGALSDDVIGKMKTVLEKITNLSEGADTSTIRLLRKKLKEKAGVCRLISKMRMLFQRPDVLDLDQLIRNLDSAIAPFKTDNLIRTERWLPNDKNTEPDVQSRGKKHFTKVTIIS